MKGVPARIGDGGFDNLERIHLDFTRETELIRRLEMVLLAAPGEPFALVLFDVDRSVELRALSIAYKLFVLGELHCFVSSLISPAAWLAPLGSRDDLALIFPVTRSTPRQEALSTADLLRAEVAKREFGREPPCRLTMSAGVSVYPVDSSQSLELFLLAEGACRIAKDRGRNRCESAASGWDQQIEFELQPARLAELEQLSLRTGRSVPDLVREAIRLVLQRHSGLERFCAGILEPDS